MKNYVEIVKVGTFYQVFGKDSLIINYLFNYKISHNRCGFPLKNIDYVISVLKKNHINFRCEDIVSKYDNNKYFDIYYEAEHKMEIKKRIDSIIDCLYNDNLLLEKVEDLCRIN